MNDNHFLREYLCRPQPGEDLAAVESLLPINTTAEERLAAAVDIIAHLQAALRYIDNMDGPGRQSVAEYWREMQWKLNALARNPIYGLRRGRP